MRPLRRCRYVPRRSPFAFFICGTPSVCRVSRSRDARERARGSGRDLPRASAPTPIRASACFSSVSRTLADDIPSASSRVPRNPPRRLAAVATRARVQAHAVQRLRHAVPPDEHARPLDARAPRGRSGRAQEEVASGVALVLESGEEAVRGRGPSRPLRHGRDRRSGVGNQGTRARDDSTREGSDGALFFSRRERFLSSVAAAARATRATRGRSGRVVRRRRAGRASVCLRAPVTGIEYQTNYHHHRGEGVERWEK